MFAFSSLNINLKRVTTNESYTTGDLVQELTALLV